MHRFVHHQTQFKLDALCHRQPMQPIMNYVHHLVGTSLQFSQILKGKGPVIEMDFEKFAIFHHYLAIFWQR